MATRQQQLAAIMTAESGGQNILSRVPVPAGYTQNQAGSGYYQMIPTTFRQGATWAGIDVPVGARAMDYDFATQTAAANAIIDRRGLQDWSGPGGKTLSIVQQIDAGRNPPLVTGPVDGGGSLTASNIGQGNPDYYTGHDPATGLPVTSSDPNNPQFSVPGVTDWQPHYASPGGTGGGGGAPAGTGIGTAAGTIGFLPPILAGGPAALGLSPGTAALVQSDVQSTQQTAKDIAAGAETATGTAFRGAVSGFLGSIENWVSRWFIIVAALVLIAVALWRLAEPQATLASMGRRVGKLVAA